MEEFKIIFILTLVITSGMLGYRIGNLRPPGEAKPHLNHFNRCSHKWEQKQVSEVDGYFWRNVCKKCGKRKI